MELTPGIVITIALVVIAGFVLVRWNARHEAASPEEPRTADAPSSVVPAASRDERASDPLVNWLLDRASEQTGVPVASDAVARGRIAEAAAKAMDDLRAGRSTSINLPFLVADASGPKHFAVRFQRNVDSTFELQG